MGGLLSGSRLDFGSFYEDDFRQFQREFVFGNLSLLLPNGLLDVLMTDGKTNVSTVNKLDLHLNCSFINPNAPLK